MRAGETARRGGRWIAATAAAFVVLLSVLAALPASAGSAPVAGKGTVLRVDSTSFPDYLDPQLSYTAVGWTAMWNTYVPLLTYRHASGRAGSDLVPGLARALPTVSGGGRTYKLWLRPGLVYSDGSPVRASDFEHAIERLFEVNSSGSPFYRVIEGAKRFAREGRGGISGIEADDASGRIVIHLTRQEGTFPQLLALPFAAPVPSSTPSQDLSFQPPPATGPYVITSSSVQGWSYARNPAWRTNGPRMPDLPGGSVDRINVRVVRRQAVEDEEVLQGKVDWELYGEPSPEESAQLRRAPGGPLVNSVPTLTTYYFWLNTARPPFDDIRVREAVEHAVDSAALRRIFRGRLEPTDQILPPDMPGYRRFDLFRFDMKRARRLLRAADPSDLQVTVWTDSESPNGKAGDYFAFCLRQLGFHVHLEVANADNYLTVIGSNQTKNLDAGWSDWFADFAHPDDFFSPNLDGSSIQSLDNQNFSQLDVPSLDRRVATLRRAPLGPSSERFYAGLDRAFMKRAAWVPFGTLLLPNVASAAVDRDALVWNPLMGGDLTSFQLSR